MGGGSSRASVSSGGVRPLNVSKLSEDQGTGSYQGPHGEASIFVRRGCELDFSLGAAPKGPAANTSSCTVELKEKHKDVVVVTFPCKLNKKQGGEAELLVASFEVPVDCPVGNYKLSFSMNDGNNSVQLPATHTLVVLFNVQNPQDAVHLEDSRMIEECLTRTETGIVLGCDSYKVKRYWGYNHMSSHVLKAGSLLLREASLPVRKDPNALTKYILDAVGSHMTAYLESIRHNVEKEARVGCVQSAQMLLASGFEEYLLKKIEKVDYGSRRRSSVSLVNDSDFANIEDDGWFDDSDDSDAEDEKLARELGLKRVTPIEYSAVVSGFAGAILRSFGVPCRLVSAFNFSSQGEEIVKEVSEGGGSKSKTNIADKYASLMSDNKEKQIKRKPRLRVCQVMLEVWLNEAWSIGRIEVSNEGVLRAYLDPLLGIPDKLKENTNPVISVKQDDKTVKVRKRTTFWACTGPRLFLEDRTKFYCDKAFQDKDDGTPSRVKLSLKGSGFLGDPLDLVVSCQAKGARVDFILVLNVVNESGKIRKLVRTFTGSKEAPFDAQRTLEVDDFRASCDKTTPTIECICLAKIFASDRTEVLSPMGETETPREQFDMELQYETMAFIPTSLVLQSNPNLATQMFRPRIMVSDRLRQDTPKLKSMALKFGSSRQTFIPEREEGRKKVVAFNWSDEVRYDQLVQIYDEVERFLNLGNRQALAQSALMAPWTMTWFDEKLPSARRATVVHEELEDIESSDSENDAEDVY